MRAPQSLLFLWCFFLLTAPYYAQSASDKKANGDWRTNDVTAWSLADAQGLMNNSPWAKRQPVPAAGRPAMTVVEAGNAGAPSPSASLGNAANANTGPDLSNGIGSAAASTSDPVHSLNASAKPSGIANAIGAPVVQPPILVLWASAAPIRLAILKLRSDGKPVSKEAVAERLVTRDHYTIAVSGLPLPEDTLDMKKLAAHSSLRKKDGTAVPALDCSHRRIGDSEVLFFRFERGRFPIATSDGEVEFRTTLGSMEVKQVFRLSSMQYRGKLAL